MVDGWGARFEIGRSRAAAARRLRGLAPRSLLCCLGACVLLASGLCASAGAAPGWLPALDLSASGVDGLEPKVAVDAAGDATAVWEKAENLQQVVQSAYRPAGGTWQAPVTLSLDSPTEDSFVPQVAMDAAGDAIVVWAHYNGGSEVVEASYRSAGGSWTAPTIVSPPGNEVPHPVVGIDARGDAIVVWELHTTPANRIEASYRPAGGAWQPPVELSDKTHDARIGLMSMNAAGDAAAVWSLDTGSTQVVQVAYRPADGAWQKPVEVSGSEAEVPSVALDAHGDARAIWRLKTGANWLVQSAYMPAAGSWQPPVELSPANSAEPRPRIAVDEAGDAVADWAASNGTNTLIEAAIGTPDGAWQPAQKLSAPGQEAVDPAVALDARGNAFAAWERSNGTNDLLEASTHPSDGGWQAPLALSAAGENASTPALAADAQGNAVALWERSNGTNQIVQAAGFDGAGPALNGLTVPATGFVGQPLSFSVSPLDTWSAIASTGWSFGDGTISSGASATHTYATPGVYTVTVTSADALTNASNAARTTTISVKPATAAPTPTISGLGQSHATWRAGTKLASISRATRGSRKKHRVPVGTTFSFRLNETARVSFAFSQAVGGRKVKGRCVARNRRNRRKRACKRTLVKGTLALSAHAGLDKLAFQGRISRTKRLAPGSYTLTLTATNAVGQHSRPATLRFKIVR